jgi:hypothetical protein
MYWPGKKRKAGGSFSSIMSELGNSAGYLIGYGQRTWYK